MASLDKSPESKFKYKVIKVTDAQMDNPSFEDNLTNYGNKGWEIIFMTRINSTNTLIIAKKLVIL